MTTVTAFYYDYKYETERMLKTLAYFHPEVNVDLRNREEIYSTPGFIGSYVYPSTGVYFFKKYGQYIHIDGDVLIVDKIDELFDTTYDAIAGRNNSDNNYAGRDRGFTLPGLDPMKYVNAGIHTVNSEDFVEEWMRACVNNTYTNIAFGEQGVLNELFRSGRYTTKILDPVEKMELWGSSFIEGTTGMHDLWKQIEVKYDSLFLGAKKIKMMHIAGGGRKPPLKDLLSREVCQWLGDVLNVS